MRGARRQTSKVQRKIRTRKQASVAKSVTVNKIITSPLATNEITKSESVTGNDDTRANIEANAVMTNVHVRASTETPNDNADNDAVNYG